MAGHVTEEFKKFIFQILEEDFDLFCENLNEHIWRNPKPFLGRCLKENLTTAQKIIVFRFLSNYEMSKEIPYKEVKNGYNSTISRL